MELVETFLKRFDLDSMHHDPIHALLCFSSPKTGKKLTHLAHQIAMKQSEESTITLLYFVDELEKELSEEEINRIRSTMSTEFIPTTEKGKITLRIFISNEKDHNTYAKEVADELGPNLIMRGIDHNEISINQIEHYTELRNDPANALQTIFTLFPEGQEKILREIVTMMNNNKTASALFIDNGSEKTNRIFIPLLSNKDIYIFTYISQLSQVEQTRIMIWDAIGITDTEPKLQKLYQSITKKSEATIQLWDNNKKIDSAFIQAQDLIMIGAEGWSRLTNTPLPWKEHLPSLLIFKDVEGK